MADDTDLQILPLDGWHRTRGARMVPFAGYHMPVQYEGVIAEHQWTRNHAGLFDVSHMGQLMLTGENVVDALETLLPGELRALKPGRIRYSLLLDDHGGIIDDLMVTNVTPDGSAPAYYMVVNGATKHGDIANLRQRLPENVQIEHLTDRALLALQGPEAAAVLDSLFSGASDDLAFMQGTSREWQGVQVGFGRSGYTGEDGFELSVPNSHAARLADALTADDRVRPIGLGARDSLRLEAGLPLYGHDLDTGTTPVAAGLSFAIGKRRRVEGGFAGADRILAELEQGPVQVRVGLDIEGRQPVRDGAMVLDGEGNEVGRVTSGTFSPTLQRPIAMAYVPAAMAAEGTALTLSQRGKLFQANVAPMPFVPHRYHRKPAPAAGATA